MPSVITANRDLIFAGGRSGNPNRYRISLTPGASKSSHLGPRMEFNQLFGQINLFGAVQGGHVSLLDDLTNRIIYLGVAVSQGIRSDAHNRHIDVLFPIQVPNLATFRLAIVGGPLVGKKHLWALRQKHVAPRDDLLGPFPKFLACAEIRALVTK